MGTVGTEAGAVYSLDGLRSGGFPDFTCIQHRGRVDVFSVKHGSDTFQCRDQARLFPVR